MLLQPVDTLLADWPQVALDARRGRPLPHRHAAAPPAAARAPRACLRPEPRAFLGSAHITGGELIPDRLLSPAEVQSLLSRSSPTLHPSR
jgi:tRNA pseudouridine55 synthase